MVSSRASELNPNWTVIKKKLGIRGCSSLSNTSYAKRQEHSDHIDAACTLPNPLIPTSEDFSVTYEVAMDCEMVGVGYLGRESALARIALVNKWGNVLYSEFVRPTDPIVDFRTEISGIRCEDLKKAKDFTEVQTAVAELMKGKILVGHSLKNDLKALLLSHPKPDIRDTSLFHPFLLKDGRKRALRHLVDEFLGVKIQTGEHCPVEDARASMLLYQKNKWRWEKSINTRVKKLKEKAH